MTENTDSQSNCKAPGSLDARLRQRCSCVSYLGARRQSEGVTLKVSSMNQLWLPAVLGERIDFGVHVCLRMVRFSMLGEGIWEAVCSLTVATASSRVLYGGSLLFSAIKYRTRKHSRNYTATSQKTKYLICFSLHALTDFQCVGLSWIPSMSTSPSYGRYSANGLVSPLTLPYR